MIVTIVTGLATFFTTMLSVTNAQEYYVISRGQQGKVKESSCFT